MEARKTAELLSELMRCPLSVTSKMMDECESLKNIVSTDSRLLIKRFKGFGKATAARLDAFTELHKRLSIETTFPQVRINNARTICSYMKEVIGFSKKEKFYAIILGSRSQILSTVLISTGSGNMCMVDQQKVFKEAILEDGSGIILVHNHPGGNPDPSAPDFSMTRAMVSFGKMIDLEIVDHLIVAGDQYYSFKEEGIIA